MKYQRSPYVKFDDIPGTLPKASAPADANLNAIAHSAVAKLNDLEESPLAPIVIWRDLLAFTGTYRTFHSPATVLKTWRSLSQKIKRSVVRVKPGRQPRIGNGGAGIGWVDVDILFTAQHGSLPQNCMGTVSVILDEDGAWRIWMLRTWLECFDGRGHPDVIQTAKHTNGVLNGITNGNDASAREVYGAVVIGGGGAGLATAGRLEALGVPYVLLEKNESIGDTWANRYESLRWHTSKEYGNLPFGHTYPAEDDYMLPTKRIGAGHKAWAEKYGIKVRTGRTVKSARWDENQRQWDLHVQVSNGGIEQLIAQNLVLAIGTGHATPVYPPWATTEQVKASGFKGSIIHAFEGYTNAHTWKGQRGVVIGTANTAHDVAEDLANAGMETTMVQRNPTFVFPAEWLHAAEDRFYNSEIDTDVADRMDFTYPNKIQRQVVNNHVWAGIKASPERFDALENAGFKLDRFGDIYDNLYVRLGGHYVDIGASARIAKGEIKVKTAAVKSLTEDGLMFEDGSEVGADLIVLCTGFDHVFRNDAKRIVGEEAAEMMDDYWGTDREGELRAHAKPAGRKSYDMADSFVGIANSFPDPNLYYHGGDVRMARFFSRFIALQIQADVLGQPLVPYLD